MGHPRPLFAFISLSATKLYTVTIYWRHSCQIFVHFRIVEGLQLPGLTRQREGVLGRFAPLLAWLLAGLEWLPWLYDVTDTMSVDAQSRSSWLGWIVELKANMKHVNSTRLCKIAGSVKGYYNVMDRKWCTDFINFSEEITRQNRLCVLEIEIDTQSRRKILNITSVKLKIW